jgi:hypothetical protein
LPVAVGAVAVAVASMRLILQAQKTSTIDLVLVVAVVAALDIMAVLADLLGHIHPEYILRVVQQ